MSQIKKIMMVGLLMVFVSGLLMIGCGSSTPNDKAPFDADARQHAAGWVSTDHKAAAQQDLNACTECHGTDFAGGISGVSCEKCHTNISPFAVTGCTSCHDVPPAGAIAPNRTGAHGIHNELPGIADECNSCHNGSGTGTSNHANGVADVTVQSLYNAMSGTAVRNIDGSCSNVSCHGGQTTPVWLSGSIDVDTQCLVCHALGTSEYNSFSSGQHEFHVVTREWGSDCWKCHNLTKLAVDHFTSLNTTTVEGPAYLTIQGYANYDKAAGTCNALCHPGIRSW